jgi:hypothetical protein
VSRALVRAVNWPPNGVLLAALAIVGGASVERHGMTGTALLSLLLCYVYAVTVELWRARH